MVARNKLSLALLMLATNACAGTPPSDKLVELRQLPEQERVHAFHELDEGAKIELFFQANRRHPPYAGLNAAIAEESKEFLLRLRGELDERAGVPEVLSFLSIAFDMKSRGILTREDIQDLRVGSICQLAERSEYCPTLVAKLLAHPQVP